MKAATAVIMADMLFDQLIGQLKFEYDFSDFLLSLLKQLLICQTSTECNILQNK